MIKDHFRTAFTISVLQTTTWFCNKYVLTELGFKYPMVFQGWQTLVGFIVLRMWTSSYLPLNLRLKKSITPLDKPGFVSLFPFFLFFTASLITGSKALSVISITEFAVGCTFVPAGIFLISERKNFCVQQVASVIVTTTSLIFGVYVCLLAASLHSRILLAPASIYLEEAFEALNFQHRRQMSFLLGSLVSGVSGAGLNAYICNFCKSPPSGIIAHVGTMVCVVGSWIVFSQAQLPNWAWILVAVNLVSHLLVPTYYGSEDEDEASHSGDDELDKEVLLA
ncbi:unnamed protein product [Lepeophtheirus salmonis]|uniref:(salmon louse) hypothetical protein n=1 Tax=Lepeophtheirus salmonis TaxID=72036 RepID=A0A7R8GZX8_LEPSM|nr:unnamed protein product [Lepeophtheirus salmonis]CAF2775518.1 unnamed protein product [Lepeophtheirus salmonis]